MNNTVEQNQNVTISDSESDDEIIDDLHEDLNEITTQITTKGINSMYFEYLKDDKLLLSLIADYLNA